METNSRFFSDLQSAADYFPNSDHVGFTETKILLDAPPSKDYKVTYSVIAPLGYAEEHSHPWDHAYFILEGKARIKIGSEVRDLGKHSLAYVPMNEDHSVRNLLNAPLIVLAIVGSSSKYNMKERIV
ncbi:MAG: cupin domain-containing protein [Thaumarchaeota archaeon]|nr:cupin domain-containing protein [Nitrososphaerota archaeon]